MTSHGSVGLMATLTNWSVLLSSLLMWSSAVGTRESTRLHVRSLPLVGGSGPPPLRWPSSHWDEMSANCPLVLITPPSLPSKICVGLPGLTMIACWSGWMPFGALRQPLSKYGAYAHHGAGMSRAS